MKLYVDIFFLVNFFMNFVVLLSQSFFQHKRIALRRLMIASLVGSLFACLFVLGGIHRKILCFVLLYVLMSIVLVRIAFGKTTVGTMLKNILFFYSISFMLAGLLIQIKELFLFSMSSIVVLLVASSFLLFVRILLPKWKRWQSDVNVYYRVRLAYKGEKVCGNALWDSGNRLQEPFTGEGVMLGEKSFLSSLWKHREEPIQRVIPYHSVGKETGLLRVFQADYLEVEKENKWYRVENPWVAICEQYLSTDGEYEMILHPQMLQEE